MKQFKRVLKTICYVSLIVSIFYYFLVAIWTTFDVSSRLLINMPFEGTIDLTTFALLFTAYLGLAYVTLTRRHIIIDLVPNPGFKVTLARDILNLLLFLVFSLLLTWQGTILVLSAWQVKEVAEILRMPIAPIKFAIPFGAFLTSIVLLIQLVELVASIRHDSKPSNEPEKPTSAGL